MAIPAKRLASSARGSSSAGWGPLPGAQWREAALAQGRGQQGHSPALRGTSTRAGSSGESRGATLTCTSSTIVGFILLLSPATLGAWLPALCKTLEIPINLLLIDMEHCHVGSIITPQSCRYLIQEERLPGSQLTEAGEALSSKAALGH